jgi:hypothetical protein
MQPRISLGYSSRGSNNLLGIGWSIDYSGSEITRCPKDFNHDDRADSVNYQSDDALCLDGARLVEVAGPGHMADGTEYRTSPDSFVKVVARGDQGNGPDSFEAMLPDGTMRIYTALTAKRVSSDAPGAGTVAAEDGLVKPVWVLAESRDRSGNAMLYHYTVLSEQQAPYEFEYRIQSIEYSAKRDSGGAMVEPARREVVFEYSTVAERPDPFFHYTSGVRHRVSRRLSWIKLYAPDPADKAFIGGYALAYESGPDQQKSFVESVTRYDRDYHKLWYRRFEWEHPPDIEFYVHNDVVTSTYGLQKMPGPVVFDSDNDGKDEMAFLGSFYRTTGGSLVPFNTSTPTVAFYGRPCDVDGDGTMEMLKISGDHRVFMKWNKAAGAFEPTPFTLANGDTEFIDADGDGRIDAFEVGPSVHPGDDSFDEEWFFRRNTGTEFAAPVAPFIAVPHMPERPASGYDTDGDGRGELHVGFCAEDDPPAEGTAAAGNDWSYYAMGTSDGGTVVHRAARPEGPRTNKVLIDLNRDGLSDILVAKGHLSTVRYNTGTGSSPRRASTQTSIRGSGSINSRSPISTATELRT